MDVKWSPTHPALFAAVDGSGRLDLWNLNQDTEVPTASINVEGCPALNKISWTPSGLHVTVGDNQGKIWVYDVAEVSVYFIARWLQRRDNLPRPRLLYISLGICNRTFF